MSAIINIVLTSLVLTFLIFIRLLRVLPRFHPRKPKPRQRGSPTHVFIVLGSGGHTAEMFMLLRDLDTASYTFRTYIVSSGDSFSAQKAVEFEDQLQQKSKKMKRAQGAYDIKTVARARKIHQSLLSTPISAAKCLWECAAALMSSNKAKNNSIEHIEPYPDLILANGPATATIMIFASVLIRFLCLRGSSDKMRCIYIESWARVATPSLSGKILLASGSCDRILAQWPSLGSRRFEYKGQLIT